VARQAIPHGARPDAHQRRGGCVPGSHLELIQFTMHARTNQGLSPSLFLCQSDSSLGRTWAWPPSRPPPVAVQFHGGRVVLDEVQYSTLSLRGWHALGRLVHGLRALERSLLRVVGDHHGNPSSSYRSWWRCFVADASSAGRQLQLEHDRPDPLRRQRRLSAHQRGWQL